MLAFFSARAGDDRLLLVKLRTRSALDLCAGTSARTAGGNDLADIVVERGPQYGAAGTARSSIPRTTGASRAWTAVVLRPIINGAGKAWLS